MGTHVIRVPDIGEGIAETEIAEWLVAPGDLVAEDQSIAAVMTDKATVEIPSPVAGRVLSLAAEAGTVIAVGAELIRLEVAGAANADAARPAPPVTQTVEAAAPVEPQAETAGPQVAPGPQTPPPDDPAPAPPQTGPSAGSQVPPGLQTPSPHAASAGAPLAAPSVRALARERGIDLQLVRGSGPEGRILRQDVEGFDPAAARPPHPKDHVEEIRIIGLRKRIAARMEEANRIPHITIVEEVDASAVDSLRQRLNDRAKAKGGAKLTLLPFIARAMVLAVADQPAMNAHHEAAAGILRRFGGVHIGIAAQTPAGLVVPVLRHAEARGLAETAAEIVRLAEAARDGRATRDELTGSTITLSSLGPLGALATTPILNVPEVAIVGVNRMAIRPFWNGTEFEPRRMMNLSCSFDHRVIDGWDAAVFVQRLKELLETPALLFVEG